MKQTQIKKPSILGPNNPDASGLEKATVKRQAPQSSDLLNELDSAIKRKPKQKSKRELVLERCGCW